MPPFYKLTSTKNPAIAYLKQTILLLAVAFITAFLIRFTHSPLFGPLDLKLFYLVNSAIKNRFFDFIIPFFSLSVLSFSLAGIFFMYLIVNKGVKVALIFIISFALMVPAGILLKKTAALTRPYAVLTDVHYYDSAKWQLMKDYSTPDSGRDRGSFPSGHTLRFFILVGFFWKKKKIKLLLLIIGVLIMLSRIYTGVHYPSDVIVSAFLAAYIGSFAHKLSLL